MPTEESPGSGEVKRLHIGSGRKLIPGWINMDADARIPGIDVVGNVQDLKQFPDGAFQEIYLSHILEHIPHGEVQGVISELYRIVGAGGTIRISVPDLDRICTLYVQNIDWFTPPHAPWVGLIYGGQTTEYDFHKAGFNFRYLKYLLETAGFSRVTEVSPAEEYGIRDASFASRPFGPISVNVVGHKGAAVERRPFDYSRTERLLTLAERPLELALSALVRLKLRSIRRRRQKMGV